MKEVTKGRKGKQSEKSVRVLVLVQRCDPYDKPYLG